MNQNLSRGLDPDLHLAAFYLKNPDLYPLANGNGLSWFSGKYQHLIGPPWLG